MPQPLGGLSIYVQAMIGVNPSPVTGRWELWCGHRHLAPTVAGLVGSSLDELFQGFSSWWESIY